MTGPRDNEPLCAITHLVAASLSVVAMILMIVFASLYGRSWHVVGVSIFGVSMIAMYTMSTIYHFFAKQHKVKHILQRLDHAMIFFLIAGTYTPICLTLPDKYIGWSVFGVIWALAITGFVLKVTGVKVNNWILLVTYIFMGWMAGVILPLIHVWLDSEGVFWLVLGGLFYSLGVIFYLLDSVVKRNRWWGMHEIFHLFVMAGTFCHFWLMLNVLIYK